MTSMLIMLSFILEPLLWLYASRRRFVLKNKKSAYMFIILDIVVSLLKEYTSVTKLVGQDIFSLTFFVYMTLFVCISFDGTARRKILHAGELLIITLMSDLVVMIVYSALHISAHRMSSSGIYNSVAMFVSKIIMFGFIQILLRIRKEITSEMTPVFFLIGFLELPIVVCFKNKMISNNLYIIICAVSHILTGFTLLYIKRMIDANKENFFAITEKSRLLEYELEKKTIQFREKLEELSKQINQTNEPYTGNIEFFENRKKIYLNKDDILYVERVGRKIRIIELNEQHEINSSIVKMEEILGRKFYKINQGMLVNKDKIDKINNDIITLRNGIILYAARDRLKEINLYESG